MLRCHVLLPLAVSAVVLACGTINEDSTPANSLLAQGKCSYTSSPQQQSVVEYCTEQYVARKLTKPDLLWGNSGLFDAPYITVDLLKV